MPLDRLATLTGELLPEPERVVPPLDEVQVAVYPVIEAPPSSVGALKDTEVAWENGVPAEMPLGGPGTVAGTVKPSDGLDEADGPTALFAVTVQMYALPFDSPGTVTGDDPPVALALAPPLDDAQVAVYPVIGEPPFDPGAEK